LVRFNAMPITDLWNSFEERAGTFADLTAVSTPEGTINFRTLRQLAGDLSRLFEARGITEGSHVALALPNSLAFAPVMLALFRMSVTTVLVSTSYRERELRGIAQGARPLVFVTTDGLVRALRQSVSARRIESLSLPNIGSLVLLFPQHAGGTAAAGSGARAWPAIPGAAIVKVTSGSTGAPKAIAVTAANLRAEAENVIATLGITPGERIYAAVPLFHSYGFDVGLLPMLYGGASLTLRDVFVPRGALDEMSNREVAVFLGVPSMYRVLLETRVTTSPDLARVRYLLSSTAPLPASLISAFYERFRTPICQHYGSSETGAATNHVPSQVLARPSSAGLPANNVRIIIGDESGLEARPGETGEVIVQSGAVAAGYLSGSPPGEPRFADGTFRTGDVGRVDDAGFLYLSGRKDEVINVGGMKVSPPEVVAVLESHPAVREAAVVGITDPSGEEVVRAAVTLKAPSTEHALLSFCQDRLSSYKIPRRIDIRDELPRSASGKVRLRSEDLRP
jgi:long-chain acyl-CoA synthetase